MLFRTLADAIVVLHLAFVIFVVLGGILVLRWPRLAWAHIPGAIWGAWIEFAGWMCPLTPLENHLRELGGQVAYPSTFVEHYVLPVLYPASLSRELQWIIGGIVVLVNAAVYAIVARRSVWTRS